MNYINLFEKVYKSCNSRMKEMNPFWYSEKYVTVRNVVRFLGEEYGEVDDVDGNHIVTDIGHKTINIFVDEENNSYHIDGINGEEPIFDGEGFEQFRYDIHKVKYWHPKR